MKTTSRRYYTSGKVSVRLSREDETGSKHDEWICDARDWKVASEIAEALNLKEANRQADDED